MRMPGFGVLTTGAWLGVSETVKNGRPVMGEILCVGSNKPTELAFGVARPSAPKEDTVLLSLSAFEVEEAGADLERLDKDPKWVSFSSGEGNISILPYLECLELVGSIKGGDQAGFKSPMM